MAEGDKWINELRMHYSREKILRSLMVEDLNGRPRLSVNESGPPQTYVFRVLNLNSGFAPMDGAKYVRHPNGAEALLMGGWVSEGVTLDSIFGTPDGIDFTEKLYTLPYPMHTYQADNVGPDDHVYTWGADTDLGFCPVTKFDGSAFSVLSADVSGTNFGMRFLSCGIGKDSYMYAGPGQSDLGGTVVYRNFVRAHISDPTNWEILASLPAGTEENPLAYSKGVLVKLPNGHFLFFSGGSYDRTILNNKIYLSTDNLATVNEIGTLPAELRGIYGTAIYWDGKIFYTPGSTASSANTKGMWYCTYPTDGDLTFHQLYDSPIESHAAPMLVFNDELHTASGSLHNNSYKISKKPYTNAVAPGARAVYSFRRVYAEYSGNCLTLYRTSDGTSINVGFAGSGANALVDVATMLSFCAGTDGYFNWYDQSGNGENATNGTLSNRYQIISGGSLIVDPQTGKIAAGITSGSQQLTRTAANLGKTYAMFCVLHPTATGREIIGAGTYAYYNVGSSATSHNANGSFGENVGAYLAENQTHLFSLFRNNSTAVQVYKNGQNMGNCIELSNNTNGFTYSNLSGEGDPSFNFIGYLQEQIVYDADMLDDKYGTELNIKEFWETP